MEVSRLRHEDEYLGEILSDDMTTLMTSAFNGRCIIYDALSFLLEHGRTKHDYFHYVKVELAISIILKR